MCKIEQFAESEFGWTESEFGNCTTWLIDMQNMLQREIDSINKGHASAETYGEINNCLFISNNKETINKIKEVLK